MRTTIVATALAVVISALGQSPARAQLVRNPLRRPSMADTGTSPAPTQPAAGDAAGKSDDKVIKTANQLPEPTPLENVAPATVILPTDPLEPYLLTKDNGPFMVLAHTFRGPEAARYAQALAIELRREHKLPAYVLQLKDFPMLSNIRGVPPTSPVNQGKAELTPPEKFRTYDEASVMVGNEKTIDGSEALLKKVRKIHPKCLDGMPTIFHWRAGTGLSRAIKTTNPYVPTQLLYPPKADPLIKHMNGGKHAIYTCPGRYSLQVADFMGRKATVIGDEPVTDRAWLSGPKSSPLMTAHEDAERLGESLANDPQIRKTGYQPYVYHDRTSSKVYVGAFNTPDDPAAVKLRDHLIKIMPYLPKKKDDPLIVPAPGLTDLGAITGRTN